MALKGTLRSWRDDRGFGFIAPTHGGREIFVHISAFPRDGSRPTEGESLSYELGRGKDGKPQAVKVFRQAVGRPSEAPRARLQPASRRSLWLGRLVGLVLLAALGVSGYSKYQSRMKVADVDAVTEVEPALEVPSPEVPAATASPQFRCDGRTHCSQMTSCSEAKFFLQNCPGTQMDGNNDGVPCEQQWCVSPSSR